MLSIFSHACWPSVCLLQRNVCLGLIPIFYCFFLILNCMEYLYILDINLLLVASFTSIFSHSISWYFILLMVSFAVQKLWSLIRLCFCFYFFCLGKPIWEYIQECFAVFSSRNFMMSSLTFRSLNLNLFLYTVWKSVSVLLIYM